MLQKKRMHSVFFLLSIFLFGCSDKPITIDDLVGIGDDISEVLGKDDSDNYGASESIAMLEIPPSLDNPNYSNALKVPKSIDSTGEILEMSDAPVLPTYMDMKIIKQGVARWLEIQSDPVSLWPYIGQFWKSQGYEIKINEPVNGILETEWKKNEISFNAESNLIDNKDFKTLVLALDNHRSALRKIPFKPPMLYFYISSNYGYRMHPVTKKKVFHHGIDLAGTWQEDILASASGTVTFAGQAGSFGNVVRVRHAFGIETVFAHLSKIRVKKGQDVSDGTVIGKMGRTGRTEGAHLHYELRVNDKSLNPQLFFDVGRAMSVSGELRVVSTER